MESFAILRHGVKGDSTKFNIHRENIRLFVKDMQAGDVITADAIRSVRLGYGLAAKYWDAIVEEVAKSSVKANTQVTRMAVELP